MDDGARTPHVSHDLLTRPRDVAAGGRPQWRLHAALWCLVGVTVAIAWWIAATPVLCALNGSVGIAYPACPSQADIAAAASLVTVGYVVLAAAGTIALAWPRTRRVGVVVLIVAAAGAVPAWLWVAHPVW